MTILPNYESFAGRHWETGSVCNAFAYQGVKAPHTGRPYSEALLLGVSGGIVMGYFSFAYQGFDPHVALLTRNTFDPLDTLLARLGVVQEVRQTANPEKGVANLLEVLDGGRAALAWADAYSLPYNALPAADGMWVMYPVLVYGYDQPADTVWIADRASVPLTVTTAELAVARGRVKKDRYRVLALGDPDPEKLAAAAGKGIQDTLKLFHSQSPRGSGENFGLAAYRRWADLLANPKRRGSWAQVFPPGRPLLAGLSTAFYGLLRPGAHDAERGQYAVFLEEAAVLLDKPGLRETAGLFRRSAAAWEAVADALLPAGAPVLERMRAIMERKAALFTTQGRAAQPELEALEGELWGLKAGAVAGFPLDETATRALLENLRQAVLAVHEVEQEAVAALEAGIRGN